MTEDAPVEDLRVGFHLAHPVRKGAHIRDRMSLPPDNNTLCFKHTWLLKGLRDDDWFILCYTQNTPVIN